MRISDWSSDVCSSDLCAARDQDPALDRALRMGEALQGFVRQHGRHAAGIIIADPDVCDVVPVMRDPGRSEEHTSELQSLMRISYAVFCLKKKNTAHRHRVIHFYLTPTASKQIYNTNV